MLSDFNRRQFLTTAAAGLTAAGTSPLWGASTGGEEPSQDDATEKKDGSGKSMLILGGTNFLGPTIVDAALSRGYEVTLFNRGKTNPGMYPKLEKLRGDRDKNELDAIKGRHWDIVVDTSGYVPAHVRDAATIVAAEGCERYVFISSVSAYDDEAKLDIKEGEPEEKVPAKAVEEIKKIRDSFQYYGGMKALCEAAAEEAMPGKALNIRPGLIVGPNDGSDRFTYWPVRVDRGGEVIVPGHGSEDVQFIDVRDLGEWTVDLADKRGAGVYNAVGFKGRLSLAELVIGCKVSTGSWAELVWIDEEFLTEQGVRPWRDLPFWSPPEYRGYFNTDKAQAAGLTTRPVGETIRDTVAWFKKERPGQRTRTGISDEKEKEVIAAWKAKNAKK